MSFKEILKNIKQKINALGHLPSTFKKTRKTTPFKPMVTMLRKIMKELISEELNLNLDQDDRTPRKNFEYRIHDLGDSFKFIFKQLGKINISNL